MAKTFNALIIKILQTSIQGLGWFALVLSPRSAMAILLFDATLWGIWFSVYWNYNYRSAFTYILCPSYTCTSIALAIPIVMSLVTYIVLAVKHSFVKMYRLKIFKISVVLSRLLYLVSALIILTKLFNGLTLLSIFIALSSTGFALGTVAGVLWVDYVGDNFDDNVKRMYVAFDSSLSTFGALLGTAVAGVVFAKSLDNFLSYGYLYLLASTIFLLGVPFLMLLKEFPEVKTMNMQRSRSTNCFDPSPLLYIAVTIPYAAVNLPTALIAPYVLQKIGGDEVWLAVMNFAEYLAWFLTPFAWSYLLKYLPSLITASIAIGISTIALAIFPYSKTLELQTIRSFIFGAGSSGLWTGLFSFIIRDVDPGKRIQYTSTVYAIQNALQAISMSFGGILADQIGSPETVFMLSLLGLISIPMLRKVQGKLISKPIEA